MTGTVLRRPIADAVTRLIGYEPLTSHERRLLAALVVVLGEIESPDSTALVAFDIAIQALATRSVECRRTKRRCAEVLT